MRCTTVGCPDYHPAAAGPCLMHAARAKKGNRNAKFAGALRDGTRTETLTSHCDPALKRRVEAHARKHGISTGRAVEDLLRSALTK